MDGLRVQITISGRIGAVLQAALCDLDVAVVPRHSVVTTGSVEIPELVRLLQTMEQHGIELERIVRSSADPLVVPAPGDVRCAADAPP